MPVFLRSNVECVTDARNALGESPVWSARDDALYWVDLRAPALLRWRPGDDSASSWPLDELVGGVALARRGGLVVALESGVHRYDTEKRTLTLLVAPEPRRAGRRMNETKADRRGRLWTSTMRDYSADDTGVLYRIDGSLHADKVLAHLRVPNALAWSPDDRTMYFADSSDGRLRAYAFDAEAGALGAMRVLVDAGALPGVPDGAAVDADGCIWNARYGGGCIARITPQGAVDRIVELPVSQPASCAFGGSDLRTLFVTTARQRLSAQQLAAEPLAGALLAVSVDVPGLPEPACALY